MENKIQMSEESYAEEWNNTSNVIRDRAGYIWMTDFAKGYDKILEIGCGNGNSTLELAKIGHKIVCIEENINCIETASKKLQQSNINFKSIRRGKNNIKYIDFTEKYEPSIQVYIIEGNIFSFGRDRDISLYNWLLDISPFDGVICWLIGTHNLDLYNILNHNQSPILYRENVQYEVAQIKDTLISKNGFIHFVDRLSHNRNNSNSNLNSYKNIFCLDLSLPIGKCETETMNIGNLDIYGGVDLSECDYDTGKPIESQKNDVDLLSIFFRL